MSAKDGHGMRIALGDGATPTESFIQLDGLMACELEMTQRLVNMVAVTGGAWQALAQGAAERMVTIHASGVMQYDAADALLQSHAFDGLAHHYRFMFASGDYLAGSFIVQRYQRSSGNDSEARGAESIALSLQSSGAVSYVEAS